MTWNVRIATLAVATLCAAPLVAQDVPAPTIDVTDTYHGVTVHDPYRWLEDGSAPAVKAWTQAQNARTRVHLDAVPSHAAIKARLNALVTRGTPSFGSFTARGDRVFAMLNDPSKQQPMLVALNAAADPASSTVLLDPNALDTAERRDRLVPAIAGRQAFRRLAVAARQRDRHAAHLRHRDRQDGRRADPSGAGADRRRQPWLGISTAARSGTRAIRAQERPEADRQFYQQVYLHKLGTDWRDDPLVPRQQGWPAARRRDFSRP